MQVSGHKQGQTYQLGKCTQAWGKEENEYRQL